MPENNLQADIDALLKGVAKTTERIEQSLDEMPGVRTPLESDAETAKLADAVNGLLAEHKAQQEAKASALEEESPEPSPPSDANPEALAAIENLDAQLAELTAQLLDTSRTAPPATDVDAVLAAANQGVVPPTAPVPSSVSPVPSAPAASPVDTAPAVAPMPVQAQAPMAAQPPSPATSGPNVDQAALGSGSGSSSGASPSDTAAPVVPGALEVVTAAESASLIEPDATPTSPGKVLLLMAAISKPLQGKSESTKIGVGLIGIFTIVLALAVWAFVFLRPPTQVKESKPFDLHGGVLPKPIEPQGRGSEGKEGHGGASSGSHGPDAPAKGAAKASTSKKDAPKKAEHGEPNGH